MVIGQMVIGKRRIGNKSIENRSIGYNHSAFVNDISKKYKRTGEYVYDGVSLTFLWPNQDAGTKESNVRIAYQLMLQQLYFLTHNTILVNKKEILQGITASLVGRIEIVRQENRVEAVRLVSLIRQMRETRDQEILMRIAHEIEDRLGVNRSFDSEGRRANETMDGDKSVREILENDIEHTFEIHKNIANSALTDVVKSSAARVSEMLQTMNETQFQEMQQFLIEAYEKQQLSRLIDAKEHTTGTASGLAHRQKYAHSAVIDRYFAGLQLMIVSEVSQTQKTDLRETIFEQQRNLLHRVYAESTEQEQTEFASYLEQAKLLYKTEERAVKGYENALRSKIAGKTASELESKRTKEPEERRIGDRVINELESKITQNITEQRTRDKIINEFESKRTKELEERRIGDRVIDELESRIKKETEEQITSGKAVNELETRLIRETTDQRETNLIRKSTEEIETRLIKETTDQITNELNSRLTNEAAVRITDEIQNKFAAVITNEKINQAENQLVDAQMVNQSPTGWPDCAAGETIRITDNVLITAIMNRTAKVSEILQTVSEAQFQEMHQILMKAYEKQQLFRLIETEESRTGMVSGLTYRQKTRYSSILDRYFAGLQSMLVPGVSQAQKKGVQETISEQQRILLRKVYTESTEQEKAEFAAYLGEAELFYRTADKTAKENETILRNNTIEQTASEIENKLAKEAAEQRTSGKGKQIGIVSKLTYRQKNGHSLVINRYLEKLQSMITSTAKRTKKTDAKETIFEQQRNILRKIIAESTVQGKGKGDLLSRIYAENTAQESAEAALYFEKPRLLYKTVVKADQQQKETKIQEIVEHCVKRTVRAAESGTVRKQMDDQKNEIAQLKEKVQRQDEQLNEFLRSDNRALNMDRMYQEIEKRMESRLHLERLRRGL